VQRHRVRVSACQERAHPIGGIARISGERDVSGVDKGERNIGKPLFGSDQRQDLRTRIELDAKASPVIVGGCLPERRRPVVSCVAMSVAAQCALIHGVDDLFGGREVRAAYSQTDDVYPSSSFGGDSLLYGGKHVRR